MYMYVCVSGASPQVAVQQAVDYMHQKVEGTGGAVALNTNGDVGIYFNTQGMSWAVAQHDQVQYGIYREDNKITKLWFITNIGVQIYKSHGM